jgi:hypothetical protein
MSNRRSSRRFNNLFLRGEGMTLYRPYSLAPERRKHRRRWVTKEVIVILSAVVLMVGLFAASLVAVAVKMGGK